MLLRHGFAAIIDGKRSPEYGAWAAAKQRCYNPNHPQYAQYGGRGIRMSKKWFNSFEEFIADMGFRPEGHSLDRINNDGHYTRSNCRWATAKEQANNRRAMKPHW